MTQCTSREDRLFVLATILRERHIDPNSSLYKNTIVKINAQSFHLPPAKIDELAKILTSAYKADHWASILGEVAQDKQEIALTIPHYEAPKSSPRYDAMRLKQMAKQDTFDGVGRLILKEVELEIGKLSPQEIIELWQTYNHKDDIVLEGNIFKVYWGGKIEVQIERASYAPIIPPVKPELFHRLEYHVEEALEKADFTANKDSIVCDEQLEDDEGTVEEEEEDLAGE